jgi:hypothetical protein
VHQQTVSAVREAGQAAAETALTTVPIVAPPNGTDEIVHEAGAGMAKDAAVEATKTKEQQQQEKQRENQQQPQDQNQQQDQKQKQQSTPPPPPPPQTCKNQPNCP